jgi:transposase
MLKVTIPVIDKFHVVKKTNEALEKCRKDIRKELPAHQRKGLMYDRYILLSRRQQRLIPNSLIFIRW